MKNAGTFSIVQELLSSKGGIYPMDLVSSKYSHSPLAQHVLFQMAQYVNIQNLILNVFQLATSKYSYCRKCQGCGSWFWHCITGYNVDLLVFYRLSVYCTRNMLHCVTDRSIICGMQSGDHRVCPPGNGLTLAPAGRSPQDGSFKAN
jgi:hypothetical protein